MYAIDLGHIITHYINQKGDTISHKKLHKLLYYVEAWHLVHFNGAIINEEFEAWVHGPVIPSLYHELKEFGFNDLKVVGDENDTPDETVNKIISDNINSDQLELIYTVLDKYGGLSSLQLEMLTHSEKPWLIARGGALPHENCKNIIDKGIIKEYYSSLIKN